MSYIDENLIALYKFLPIAKLIACILLLTLLTFAVLKILGIRLIDEKGVKRELKNIQEMRNRDNYILRVNKVLKTITDIVEKSTFKMDKNNKETMRYNLKRAEIKVIGGFRLLEAEEYNAILKILSLIALALAVIVAVVANLKMGLMLAIGLIMIINMAPGIIIRSIVENYNQAIKDNFLDFYLRLHYILMRGANTPTNKVLKAYVKNAESKEMARFANNYINYIETYGDYYAVSYMSRNYKEIAVVTKLMRLIKQLHDGGDVNQDLEGFRRELLKEEKNKAQKRQEKIKIQAERSFTVLFVLLIQAVISAMAIYLPDITQAKNLFGM